MRRVNIWDPIVHILHFWPEYSPSYFLSGHFSVSARIDLVIPKLPPKTITYPAVNKINLAQFKNDLPKSDLIHLPTAMPLLSISYTIPPCHSF